MEEELQGPVDERIKDREASFVRVAQTSIESVQITCLGSTCKEVTCDTDEDIETCIDAKVAHSESRTICEIDFAARRSLLRYKCEKCGRECPSKHKLKRHLSTHSDARPFPCKICGRSFKWSEYLQKHMRLQHPSGKKGSIVDVPKCSLSPDKQCGVQVTGLRYASLQKEVTPSKSQDTLEEIGIYSERGCSENESMEDCEFSSGKEKSDTAGDTEKLMTLLLLTEMSLIWTIMREILSGTQQGWSLKLVKCTHPKKEAINLCIEDLQEQGIIEANIGGSGDWTDLILTEGDYNTLITWFICYSIPLK